MSPAPDKVTTSNLETQQAISASPPDPKSTQITQRFAASMQFSGPIPPPGFLEQYERISPGLASRMVGMAESEAEHRRLIEARLVDSHCADQKAHHDEVTRGQVLATVITISALIAGSVTALHGYQIAGSILGASGIGGIAVTLILGRNARQESQNSSKEVEPKAG